MHKSEIVSLPTFILYNMQVQVATSLYDDNDKYAKTLYDTVSNFLLEQTQAENLEGRPKDWQEYLITELSVWLEQNKTKKKFSASTCTVEELRRDIVNEAFEKVWN